MTPTQTKVAILLAQNVDKKLIQIQAGVSLKTIYKVQREHGAEIEALKASGPVESSSPCVPAATGASKACSIPVPSIDKNLPRPPQLEGFAWDLIAEAAAGGPVTARQQAAAKEIIKQATRERPPAKSDKKFTFKIDIIDLRDQAFEAVSANTYEVRQ